MGVGQNVGGFKGKISGSVRSVVLHPTLPIVASCGNTTVLIVFKISSYLNGFFCNSLVCLFYSTLLFCYQCFHYLFFIP